MKSSPAGIINSREPVYHCFGCKKEIFVPPRYTVPKLNGHAYHPHCYLKELECVQTKSKKK